MQIRAGSLFDNHFEAGIVFMCLQMLGWKQKWKRRADVTAFVKNVTYCARTQKEAETKLKVLLGSVENKEKL